MIKSKLQNIEWAVLFRSFVRATEATEKNKIKGLHSWKSDQWKEGKKGALNYVFVTYFSWKETFAFSFDHEW